ncbi:hypothetical protein [Prosthecomicrobium sp. N25]|uniref:hypothetical protein n=1 Tax=Prosthecomicrobium sp. N25 TaxID=3129254 RepID=UPI003076A0F5
MFRTGSLGAGFATGMAAFALVLLLTSALQPRWPTMMEPEFRGSTEIEGGVALRTDPSTQTTVVWKVASP